MNLLYTREISGFGQLFPLWDLNQPLWPTYSGLRPGNGPKGPVFSHIWPIGPG